jgi:hypothetical protein
MKKQCRECQSVINSEAPYCDACGCQFRKVPATPLQLSSRWKYRSLAIVASTLAIAVIQLVWTR